MTIAKTNLEYQDTNPDPITGAPGSHPVGTGVGAAGGGLAGMIAGGLFGPIGMLVGAAAGTIAGAAAGHGTAEVLDPTAEAEYWRTGYRTRPYYDAKRDYDVDYAPAYRYGLAARTRYPDRTWDSTLEADLGREWETSKETSALSWTQARAAARDAWDRADRSYRVYNNSDRYYQSRLDSADYRDPEHGFEDYRSAYRYGTYARAAHPTRAWDDALESDLGRGWDKFKGNSRLSWEKAKSATRDAWHSVERALPGDADNDGR